MDPDPILTLTDDPTATTYIFDRTNVGDPAPTFTIGIRTADSYNIAALTKEEAGRLFDVLLAWRADVGLVEGAPCHGDLGADEVDVCCLRCAWHGAVKVSPHATVLHRDDEDAQP